MPYRSEEGQKSTPLLTIYGRFTLKASDLWTQGWKRGSESIKIHAQSLMVHMGAAVTEIIPEVTWCVNLLAPRHRDDGSDKHSWV